MRRTDMNNYSFDAVIFDMDGVVTKTARVHAKAWKTVFDEYLESRAKKNKETFKEFTYEEDYLNYVDSNYGYNGSTYKQLKIMADIDVPDGDLSMHSPCAIQLNEYISLTAQHGMVCLDGRTGVQHDNGFSASAERVAILSEKGDAHFGHGSTINAEELFIQAYGTAKVGNNAVLNISGLFTILSTSDKLGSKTWIKQGSTIVADTIIMKGFGDVVIDVHTAINAQGAIWMFSTGGSKAWIKPDCHLHATALCMEAKNEVIIGEHADITVEGEIRMISTGDYQNSKVWIKQGAEVAAENLEMSGQNTTLGMNSSVSAISNFHMEAEDSQKCTLMGSYSAATISGNCLE